MPCIGTLSYHRSTRLILFNQRSKYRSIKPANIFSFPSRHLPFFLPSLSVFRLTGAAQGLPGLPNSSRKRGRRCFLSIETTRDVAFNERRFGEATALAAIFLYAEFHLAEHRAQPTEFSRELGRVLKYVRDVSGVSQEELAVSIGTTRIALSRWEAGLQPPTFGPFQRWCRSLDLLAVDTPTIVTVSDITSELLRMLGNEPDRLRELSAESFESLVAERLDKAGFEVQRTGSTNARDGGIDLIAPELRTLFFNSLLFRSNITKRRGRPAEKMLIAYCLEGGASSTPVCRLQIRLLAETPCGLPLRKPVETSFACVILRT